MQRPFAVDVIESAPQLRMTRGQSPDSFVFFALPGLPVSRLRMMLALSIRFGHQLVPGRAGAHATARPALRALAVVERPSWLVPIQPGS